MMRSVAGGPGLSVFLRLVMAAAFAAAALPAVADPVYFPGDQWERRAPAAAGFDPAVLEEAIRYAQQNEAPWERDVFKQIQKDVANEPYPAIIGETRERGGPAGMVVRHGYLVAQWGDIDRVDMSFSVAKSYLSAVAGLAIDGGLIADVNDRVADYVQDGGFDDNHNRKVTWHMLLNQTSEWEGTLWDKPDVADRRRGYDRRLQAPGTFWEYNDVRVNRLALALLRVYQRPLPEEKKTFVEQEPRREHFEHRREHRPEEQHDRHRHTHEEKRRDDSHTHHHREEHKKESAHSHPVAKRFVKRKVKRVVGY